MNTFEAGPVVRRVARIFLLPGVIAAVVALLVAGSVSAKVVLVERLRLDYTRRQPVRRELRIRHAHERRTPERRAPVARQSRQRSAALNGSWHDEREGATSTLDQRDYRSTMRFLA